MTYLDDDQDLVPGTDRPLFPDPDEPAWVSKPKLYHDFDLVDGTTRLYTIGALAEALEKSVVTIRSWIRNGVIPDSGLRTQGIPGTLGEAGRRLWTREQIESIVDIAASEGVLGKSRKQSWSQSSLSVRVWELWRRNNW